MTPLRLPIRAVASAALVLTIATTAAGCNYSYLDQPTAPSTTDSSATTTTSGITTLTYVKDVQPVLAADCVRCHGPSRREAGVDLSSYANVLKTLSPGNASSLLILVTRSGGVMNSQFSGNRSQKATLIRNWIVSSNAAQQ